MSLKIVNGNTTMGASGANHASGVVPDPGATAGTNKFLREDASFENAVQSVAISTPSEFTVTGSPVTTSGTISITKATQAANTIWSGPVSGSAAEPTFRNLVSADIPNNAANTTGTSSNVTGIVAIANGGTNASTASAALSNLGGAPIASPTFTGTVTQPTPSVLTGATVATSAVAGSASALPATPTGYLQISINSANVLIPFFST